jgi:hypothetical protein
MTAEKIERPVSVSSVTSDWEKKIWQRYRSRCANCGQEERLRVKMIVPLEAGGQMSESNGVLLCRSCEMAAEASKKDSKANDQRLVNFWVSRRLFDRIQEGLQTYKAFNSMGSLVRYLISKYIEDESRFDDLELYQDEGADSKLNVWVERDRYDTFKVLLDKRGMTVTDAIKSLIRMYEEQSEINIERRTPVGEA